LALSGVFCGLGLALVRWPPFKEAFVLRPSPTQPAPAEPVFYRIEKEMKKPANYLAGCLLLGGLVLLHAPQAHAQDDVKEATKINKQRNKLAAQHTDLSKDALNYDAEFLVAAASSNQLEIALGQLGRVDN
jgi:hypothetical protein